MVEKILHKNQLLAIIVSHRFRENGIHFFTPDDLTQQLAFMRHPVGRKIAPHLHNPVPRTICYTQEVLFIRRGKLRVDFYDEMRNFLESRVLEEGDTILLSSGGHGFEVLEEVEMLEVKQGPYVGDHDKTKFEVMDEKILKTGD